MAAIITEKFRKNLSAEFLADIKGFRGNRYYIGLSKSTDYNEGEIPFPVGTPFDQQDVLDEMTMLFRASQSGSSYMIPRVTVYDQHQYKVYDPYDPTCFYATGDLNPCYAVVGTRIYLCIGLSDNTSHVFNDFAGESAFSFYANISQGIQTIGGLRWALLGKFDQFNGLNTNRFIAIDEEPINANEQSKAAGTLDDIFYEATLDGVVGNGITVQHENNENLPSALPVIGVIGTDPETVVVNVRDDATLVLSGDVRFDGTYILDTVDELYYKENATINDKIEFNSSSEAWEIFSFGGDYIASDTQNVTVAASNWPGTALIVEAHSHQPVHIVDAINNSVDAGTVLTARFIGEENSITDIPTTSNTSLDGGGTVVNALKSVYGGLLYGFNIVNGGTGYSNGILNINVDGINGNATPGNYGTVIQVDIEVDGAGTITHMKPLNTYQYTSLNWKKASAVVPDSTGSTASIIPLFAPVEGFGYDMVRDLPSWYIGILANTDVITSENDEDYIEYRNISLVKNPTHGENEVVSQVYNPLKSFTLAGYVGTIEKGDIISQDGTVVGIAVAHTGDDVFYESSPSAGFGVINSLENIVINSTSTSTLPTNINDDLLGGEVVFIEKRDKISRSEGQGEELKIIIQL